MLKKTFISALIISALFSGVAVAAEPNAAAGQDAFTLDIRGYVPVICRASVAATEVASQAGQASIGQMNQFCNDPNGYQVWIDYSPQLADASIVVDGKSVNLSSSGSTLISMSDGPSIEQHDLALNLPKSGVQASLSIRVVAL